MEAFQHQAEETIRAVIQGVHEGTSRGEFVIHERLFSNSAKRHPERMDELLEKWAYLIRSLGQYQQFQKPVEALVSSAVVRLRATGLDCLTGFYDPLVVSMGADAEWCLQVTLKAYSIPDDPLVKTEIVLQVYIPKTNNGLKNPINLYTQAMSLDLTPKPKKQPGDIRQRQQRNISGRKAYA